MEGNPSIQGSLRASNKRPKHQGGTGSSCGVESGARGSIKMSSWEAKTGEGTEKSTDPCASCELWGWDVRRRDGILHSSPFESVGQSTEEAWQLIQPKPAQSLCNHHPFALSFSFRISLL